MLIRARMRDLTVDLLSMREQAVLAITLLSHWSDMASLGSSDLCQLFLGMRIHSLSCCQCLLSSCGHLLRLLHLSCQFDLLLLRHSQLLMCGKHPAMNSLCHFMPMHSQKSAQGSEYLWTSHGVLNGSAACWLTTTSELFDIYSLHSNHK